MTFRAFVVALARISVCIRRTMLRADIVTVAATSHYGKPRPAVMMHTDALPSAHASTCICQMTSVCSDAADCRVTVEPTTKNGLRARS
ncbi:MAG: type II toxin-antitoxin system PemK/MazF family toxin [Pseudomonadota bacterium]|jgi:mRNA interferase MazF